MERKTRKINTTAGFTEKSRKQKLQTLKRKWLDKGCDVIEEFDGGLTKASFIVVEETSNTNVSGKARDPRLEEIYRQIAAIGDTDTFGIRKEIKFLPEVLADDEVILALTSGLMDASTWLIVCTPVRVILLDKGMLYGLSQKEYPLKNITSIQFKQGLILGEIELTVSSNKMKIENVEKKSVKKFVETLKAAISNVAEDTPAEKSSSTGNDIVDKLRELSEFREAGVLSDDEFEIAKVRLLS